MQLSQARNLGVAMLATAAMSASPAAWADREGADGAEWWQWVLSIPAGENPLTDATGARCMVGQRAHDWFLAGTFLGETAERTCELPSGSWLFFPVINQVWIDTPGQCGQGAPSTEQEMRDFIAPLIDQAANLSATLDGQALVPVRLKSEIFPVTLPDGNLFQPFCAELVGVYPRNVDDGYYVQVHPLSVGKHELRIHAESPAFGFTLDVIYHLVVVPRHRKP